MFCFVRSRSLALTMISHRKSCILPIQVIQTNYFEKSCSGGLINFSPDGKAYSCLSLDNEGAWSCRWFSWIIYSYSFIWEKCLYDTWESDTISWHHMLKILKNSPCRRWNRVQVAKRRQPRLHFQGGTKSLGTWVSSSLRFWYIYV